MTGQLIPLFDAIVVTCECGRTMVPMIAGPGEVLYICASIETDADKRDPPCTAPQVNVMTKGRAEELRLRAQDPA